MNTMSPWIDNQKQREYERLQDRNPGGPAFEDYERDGFEDDGECPNLSDCAEQGRKSCRGCGDFDVWPSNEQMEYFKRGGR